MRTTSSVQRSWKGNKAKRKRRKEATTNHMSSVEDSRPPNPDAHTHTRLLQHTCNIIRQLLDVHAIVGLRL